MTSDERTPYLMFDRDQWSALRFGTPLTLSDADIAALGKASETIASAEVADIYLPLSRLLNQHVTAARERGHARHAFPGRPAANTPYLIALVGSVAAGKSTVARLLRALLAQWPDHRRVELVTTDGFLLPNRLLAERGLMARKGFPESYDLPRLLQFLAAVKAGESEVAAPVYSHVTYDIVADERRVVRKPDVLILEGLNLLQPAHGAPSAISDFLDFSIYIDAAEADLADWFVGRFLSLLRTAAQDPSSHFWNYKDLTIAQAQDIAGKIWREINLKNLHENILPTRERADLVLRKRADHSVGEIQMRRT